MAEATPRGTAMTTMMTSSMALRSRVMGSRSAILSSTGRPSGAKERPKSSRITRFSQFQYWTASGLSRPNSWRRSCADLGAPLGGEVALLQLGGLAGGEVNHDEGDEGDADEKGQRQQERAAQGVGEHGPAILASALPLVGSPGRVALLHPGHEPLGEVVADARRSRDGCRAPARTPRAARRGSRGR